MTRRDPRAVVFVGKLRGLGRKPHLRAVSDRMHTKRVRVRALATETQEKRA